MSVQHLGDVISALLDGELAGPARAAAESHLAGCHACAAEYQATASIRSAVRALPPVEPPFGVIERILLAKGSGRAEPTRARRRPPVWVAGVAAAASLAILAAVPRHTHSVQPPVATFVDAHATATPGADPVSGLAPVALPVSFRSP
jgi:anti-sigma factor RsiW